MPESVASLVASPTGRVEVVRREAPDGEPVSPPAHLLQHPYRPFAAAEAAADRHRVASIAAALHHRSCLMHLHE